MNEKDDDDSDACSDSSSEEEPEPETMDKVKKALKQLEYDGDSLSPKKNSLRERESIMKKRKNTVFVANKLNLSQGGHNKNKSFQGKSSSPSKKHYKDYLEE